MDIVAIKQLELVCILCSTLVSVVIILAALTVTDAIREQTAALMDDDEDGNDGKLAG